jgi:S1-C subfamily serine protease
MKTTEIIEKNKKSVILLALIKKAENQLSIRGTGFIISKDGKFVTNAHVFNEIPETEKEYLMAQIIDKVDENGITHYKEYKVKIISLDKENDMALMQIITENNTEFEIISEFEESEQVREGEEAIFIGYPLATELISIGFGITMSANACIISSVKRRGIDGSLHFFMIDSHVNNGSSGSPVFSKETGKVIGIISGKISQRIPMADGKNLDIPANMGICIPSKYTEEIIKKNN